MKKKWNFLIWESPFKAIGRHISLSCVEVKYGICQQLSGFST